MEVDDSGMGNIVDNTYNGNTCDTNKPSENLYINISHN